MAKTCRTCELRDCYCDEPPGTLVHIRRIGADGHDCPYWSEAETPLLVDELAEALGAILRALSKDWHLPAWKEAQRLYNQAEKVLARHKEEVSNA